MPINQVDDVAVFLKTSEEASCDPVSKRQFTWIQDIPLLENAITNFDETLNEW